MSTSGNALASLIVRFIADSQDLHQGIDDLSTQVSKLGEDFDISKITEGFGELAAAAGITVGAVEILRSSLESFAQSQDVISSFTLLSGSAETAKDTFEGLKETAVSLAVPFETLVEVTQRLTPQFGVGTSQLAQVLQAAGDAAAATGRDFSTIAEGLDRIAVTGAVSTRQLVQLGVSVGDIANAMGVSITEANALIKKGGQDAQADVDAVIEAIEQKYGGAADLIAQNLGGTFTNLKTELGLIGEELGAAIAPLASDFVDGLAGLESTFKGIAAGAQLAVPAIEAIADAIKRITPGFIQDIFSSSAMISFGTAVGFVAQGVATLVDIMHGAITETSDFIASLNPFSSGLAKLKDDFASAGVQISADLAKFGDIAAAGDKLQQSFSDVKIPVFGDTVVSEGVKALAGGINSLADAFAALGVKTAPTQAEFDKLASALDYIKAQFEAGKISSQTYSAAVDDFVKKMNSLQGAFVAATQPIDELGAALRAAGIKDTSDDLVRLQAGVDAAGQAYSIGRISAGQYADEIDKLDKAALSSATDGLPGLITQLKIAEQDFADFGDTPKTLADALNAVVEATPSFQDAVNKQNAAIGGFLVSMTSVTQTTPNVAQILESFGQETADDVTSHIARLQAALDSANAALKVGVPGAALAAQLAYEGLVQEQQKLSNQALDDKTLGIPNLADLQAKLTEVNKAYQDLADKGLLNSTTALEGNIAQQKLAVAIAVQSGQDATDLQIKLDQTTEALKRQTTGWADVYKQLNQVVTSDISATFDDIIFHLDKVGADFAKLGQDIVDTIVNGIIKQALSPLIESLDKLIVEGVKWLADLLGIGGIFGSAAASGPAIAATTANTTAVTANTAALGSLTAAMGAGDASAAGSAAGGAAGGGGGALGGVGGIINTVSGVVTAIASVATAIGTFVEGGAMNDKLFKILNDTDRMDIMIEKNGAETIFGWTKVGGQMLQEYLPPIQGILNNISAAAQNTEAYMLTATNWLLALPDLLTPIRDIANSIDAGFSNLLNFFWNTLQGDLFNVQNKLDVLNQSVVSLKLSGPILGAASVNPSVTTLQINSTVQLDSQELFQSFVTWMDQNGKVIPGF